MADMKIFFVWCFATFAAAGAYALPSELSLDDELTLNGTPPHFDITTEAQARPTYLDGDHLLAIQETPLLYADRAPDRPGSVTDIEGMNYADLKNDVKTVAYRSPRGLGLGVASTGGVALTGGYATPSGMRINLYYVRSFSELNNEASRATGLDFTNLPLQSVGFTVGWKF